MTLRPEMCLFMTERHHSSDPSSPQRRFLKEADAYMGLPEIIGHVSVVGEGGAARVERSTVQCVGVEVSGKAVSQGHRKFT